MIYDVREFGAVGDGKTLNTEAIQKTIDACAAAGGGRVLLENGVYLTGTIFLASNVDFHIAAGAVLLGSKDGKNYPNHETKHVTRELLPRWKSTCIIYAEECENLSLSGNGTIDCNGDDFVARIEGDFIGWPYYRRSADSPARAVFLTGCRNVTVEGLTMIHQPAGWSYWIHDCDYVTCDKLKILANVEYPNNDGIHVNSSRNVTISNCSITCGDDCIIVRANNASLKENKVCERVVVTNCNLTSYSGGIRIGWIKDGVIRNCSFANLVMTDTTTGIDIHLPYFALDPNNFATADQGREATLIENLSFSNIVMDKQCGKPIKILIDQNPALPCTAIRNLHFSNIHSKGPSMPLMMGREDCPLENIWFSDCSFTATDGTEIPNRFHHGAVYDCPDGRFPLTIRYLNGLKLNNTEFSFL